MGSISRVSLSGGFGGKVLSVSLHDEEAGGTWKIRLSQPVENDETGQGVEIGKSEVPHGDGAIPLVVAACNDLVGFEAATWAQRKLTEMNRARIF